MTAAPVFVVGAAAALFSLGVPAVAGAQDPATAGAPPASPIATKVDELFAAWDRQDSPGCSLGVSLDGALVYERGYGMANLELGVPITPASVFHVASISKQFTAMSILLLVQRGHLSLDDEVQKHIPEWSDSRNRITIRHLLTHTAGLRDPFLLRELAPPRDRAFDTDAIASLLARQQGLNFAPGSQFQYSNGGYALLATIVKRLSGQSLRAFAGANIFAPLGMTQTHIHDDPTEIVPNRTSGYRREAGAVKLALHADLGRIVGTTAVFTTARDLLRWQRNFEDVRVGDPALVAAMQEPAVLTNGERTPYGFGLWIGNDRGLRTINHGGGDPGYAAHVIRYPDERLAVAVLCNLDGFDPAKLAQGVGGIYLAGAMTAAASPREPATVKPVTLPAGELANKEGLYHDPATDALLRIFVRDGKLRGSSGAGADGGWEVAPVSPSRFVIPGTAIALEFVASPAGRVQEMHIIGDLPTTQVLRRLDAVAPATGELRALAADYASSELDAAYTLSVRDSGLVLRIPGRSPIALQPIFPDGFAGSLVGVVKFSRGAGGTVTGFTINTNGVRGLRFDRVKQ